MAPPDAAGAAGAGVPGPGLIQIVCQDAGLSAGIATHLQTLGKFTTVCHDDDSIVARRLAAAPRYLAALVVGACTPSATHAEICAAFRLRGVTLPILLAGARAFDPWPAIRHAVAPPQHATSGDTGGRVQACLSDRFHTVAYGRAACFTIGAATYCAGPKALVPDDGGGPIRLTPIEAALLEALWLRRARPVAGPVLAEAIWGHACAQTQRALKTHIYNLRRKIEPNASLQDRVLLTESSGYRLLPAGLQI
jgi:hypothetical protein